MENAVEALKMAFGVFVFIMALSISISTFSLARETADIVLQSADETAYYDYEEGTGAEYRTVGLETIIPTIYKYNKENYTIKFKTGTLSNGEIQETGDITLYKSPATNENISELDLNAERTRNEPWIGSNDEVKKHLDAMVQGGTYEFNDSTGGNLKYTTGLIEKWQNAQFVELIGREQETEDETTGENTNRNQTTSKTIVTYVLLN